MIFLFIYHVETYLQLNICHVETLLHMTICHIEKFLHITDFLSTTSGCDKYQVCLRLHEFNILNKIGHLLQCGVECWRVNPVTKGSVWSTFKRELTRSGLPGDSLQGSAWWGGSAVNLASQSSSCHLLHVLKIQPPSLCLPCLNTTSP